MINWQGSSPNQQALAYTYLSIFRCDHRRFGVNSAELYTIVSKEIGWLPRSETYMYIHVPEYYMCLNGVLMRAKAITQNWISYVCIYDHGVCATILPKRVAYSNNYVVVAGIQQAPL